MSKFSRWFVLVLFPRPKCTKVRKYAVLTWSHDKSRGALWCSCSFLFLFCCASKFSAGFPLSRKEVGKIPKTSYFRSYYEQSSLVAHENWNLQGGRKSKNKPSRAFHYFSSRAIPIPSDRSAQLYGFLGAKTPKCLVGRSCPDSCRRGFHRAFETWKRKY